MTCKVALTSRQVLESNVVKESSRSTTAFTKKVLYDLYAEEMAAWHISSRQVFYRQCYNCYKKENSHRKSNKPGDIFQVYDALIAKAVSVKILAIVADT